MTDKQTLRQQLNIQIGHLQERYVYICKHGPRTLKSRYKKQILITKIQRALI